MIQKNKLRSIYLQRLNINSEMVAGSVTAGNQPIRRWGLSFYGKIFQLMDSSQQRMT